MEVKINKELRDFSESVFFGLSLRQFVFSALAVGVAIAIYFSLVDLLGTEVTGWICILAALPLGLAGFFRYQGLPLEVFLTHFIRSEFLFPREMCLPGENSFLQQSKTQEVRCLKLLQVLLRSTKL